MSSYIKWHEGIKVAELTRDNGEIVEVLVKGRTVYEVVDDRLVSRILSDK